jgi:putative tricarboxylic transport membrane protein
MIGSGVAAYFLAKNDYPIAPLVLALILGPLIENNLRRAMNQFNGDWTHFLTDPISLIFLVIAVLWVSIPQLMKLRGKQVLVEEG